MRVNIKNSCLICLINNIPGRNRPVNRPIRDPHILGCKTIKYNLYRVRFSGERTPDDYPRGNATNTTNNISSSNAVKKKNHSKNEGKCADFGARKTVSGCIVIVFENRMRTLTNRWYAVFTKKKNFKFTRRLTGPIGVFSDPLTHRDVLFLDVKHFSRWKYVRPVNVYPLPGYIINHRTSYRSLLIDIFEHFKGIEFSFLN